VTDSTINSASSIQLSPFSHVIDQLKRGEMIVLVDNAAREDEGDLVVLAQDLKAEHLAFMFHRARGLVCLSIDRERAARLNLPFQVALNGSRFQTPFAISVDLASVAGTGSSASSRVATIKAIMDDNCVADDFVSPGHVFPLVANIAGVFGRQGQTEGSLDLAKICGAQPGAIICEILNEDGTLMRGAALRDFAKQHNLSITSVDEIIKYRKMNEILIREASDEVRATRWGDFRVRTIIDDADGKEHMLLTYGDISNASDPVPFRIHSECLTGDVFGSRRCDCGPQLDFSMRFIVSHGRGALLYLRQEGRGIGLLNKLRAYALQDQGHDTVEANIKLGFEADERDFMVANKVLKSYGIQRVLLLSNNPHKLETLLSAEFDVVERIPVVVPQDKYSANYLETKRSKLGHLL